MKERIFIFGALGLLLAILVALNAVSYVQREKIPDSEAVPNRSTYATGPTGTRAFFDLAAATGRQVQRWESPVSELNDDGNSVSVFVIVGMPRREIEPDEIGQILEWVKDGGRLVVIDRDPPDGLLKTSASWRIALANDDEKLTPGELKVLLPSVDPSNSTQMTGAEPAAKPLQPTAFTLGVNAVQPSKFVTSLLASRLQNNASKARDAAAPANSDEKDAEKPFEFTMKKQGEPREDPEAAVETSDDREGGKEGAQLPASAEKEEKAGVSDETIRGQDMEKPDSDVGTEAVIVDYSKTAPVFHLGSSKRQILVDYPYGFGTIVVLTDPYIVSNGGIKLVDNSQLGLNLLSTGGLVAFDEFHQGFGSANNRFLSYFAGTPTIPLFFQLFLVLGLLMLSKSRRFARPLPLEAPSRLTKLEYVSAMAQLKRRTKAFDLAVENIYTDFRRRVSRLAGLDNHHTGNRELADAVASRTAYEADEIADLMFKCEDIMHGEPTTRKEVLRIAAKIREIERALNLSRGRSSLHK